jgi:hypothetical protein
VGRFIIVSHKQLPPHVDAAIRFPDRADNRRVNREEENSLRLRLVHGHLKLFDSGAARGWLGGAGASSPQSEEVTPTT